MLPRQEPSQAHHLPLFGLLGPLRPSPLRLRAQPACCLCFLVTRGHSYGLYWGGRPWDNDGHAPKVHVLAQTSRPPQAVAQSAQHLKSSSSSSSSSSRAERHRQGRPARPPSQPSSGTSAMTRARPAALTSQGHWGPTGLQKAP